MLRFPCDFPVEIVCLGQRIQGCAIEVSFGGLRVRCCGAVRSGLLRSGRAVRIRNLDTAFEHALAYVAGRIRWVARQTGLTMLGIEFDRPQVETSWVVTVLQNLRALRVEQKRSSIRVRCNLPCHYLLKGSPPVDGVLSDLSWGGTCLETLSPIEAEQTLAIVSEPWKDLPPLHLVGTVLRSQKSLSVNQHGIVFGELLTPTQERVLRHYLDTLMKG